MSKKKKILMMLMGCLALMACNPFKVTDPSDPRFNPDKFRFEDYNNGKELQKVINEIFPSGSSKEKVESILVARLQSSVSVQNPDEGWQLYHYKNIWNFLGEILSPGASNLGSYKLYIYYDQNNKVLNICAYTISCSLEKEDN